MSCTSPVQSSTQFFAWCAPTDHRPDQTLQQSFESSTYSQTMPGRRSELIKIFNKWVPLLDDGHSFPFIVVANFMPHSVQISVCVHFCFHVALCYPGILSLVGNQSTGAWGHIILLIPYLLGRAGGKCRAERDLSKRDCGWIKFWLAYEMKQIWDFIKSRELHYEKV